MDLRDALQKQVRRNVNLSLWEILKRFVVEKEALLLHCV